jgi:ABC-type antimicrobial peptide transport system permease subunit
VLNHRDVQIIGVVKDVRHAGPEQELDAAAYVPLAQRASSRPVHFVVKTVGDPALLMATVRRQADGASVDGLTYNVMTFDDIRERYVRDRRFVMTMMLWFGGLALTLAILGLYGVISYLVHLRTREIGVRVALGASALEIRAGVLARAAKHSLAGVAIGTAIALALSHVLGSVVQNLGKPDALTLAIVAITIMFVSAMAAWIPAHRATRIDPVQALRFE